MTTNLDLVAAHARTMLAGLTDFAPLRPRDADYDAVFLPAATASARAGYAGLWAAPPPWPVKPTQTDIHVHAARSEDLASDPFFPGGYKDIARFVKPGQIWMLWEHVVPGERAGMSFDGLVAFADHYAWFPKPWRVVPPPG